MFRLWKWSGFGLWALSAIVSPFSQKDSYSGQGYSPKTLTFTLMLTFSCKKCLWKVLTSHGGIRSFLSIKNTSLCINPAANLVVNASSIPKCGQHDTKTTPKWCQNDAKFIQRDRKMAPNWPKNGPKFPQNDPFRFQNSPKIITEKTTQKPSKPSKTVIKTLKIHSGYFQTYPLAVHFLRSKRNLLTSF